MTRRAGQVNGTGRHSTPCPLSSRYSSTDFHET